MSWSKLTSVWSIVTSKWSHSDVLTGSLQLLIAAKVSLGVVMYFKKQTSFFFQKITGTTL